MLRQLGMLLSSLQGAPGGVHRRVWEELTPWLGQLAGHAAQKWVPRLAAGNACQVPVVRQGHVVGPCRGNAIAACMVCRRPVCLGHAFVDQFGEAVCYPCAAAAAEAPPRPEAPPSDPAAAAAARVIWARRLLKLKKAATREDARGAWRKLSAKHHPDRFPADQKAAEEAKFKEIQNAWDVMQQWFAKQAA